MAAILGWLAPALALLAGAGFRVATRLIGSRGAQLAVAGVGGATLAGGGLGIPGVDLFPDGDRPGRRRRRRRALSQGDRDDIAFIAATISNVAAGKFAVMLATRAR